MRGVAFPMSPRTARTPLFAALAWVVVGAASASAMDWVTVGSPGNPPDDEVACQAGTTLHCRANIGAVSYRFRIARQEVTNAEYAAFLNAVADADPLGLFNANMQVVGDITRTGTSGSFVYTVTPGRESWPVRYTDWYRALRFANWLHNGEPTGPQGASTTEDGAYTLLGVNDPDVQRNPGALFWLPTEDEWYKAAFYDPSIPGYWDYSTGSDVPPVGEPPPGGANSANYCPTDFTQGGPASCLPGVSMGPNQPTDVGAYAAATSPWGTFDQTGNVWEWLEDTVQTSPQQTACIRGSFFARGPADAASFARSNSVKLCAGCSGIGFRMARRAPKKNCGLGFEAAPAVWLVLRLRRRRRG
jgi:formylglycine-generating enzyme required for sulfatase activity